MNNIKNILSALDLSSTDDMIIKYTAFFSGLLKSEKLDLIHVVANSNPFDFNSGTTSNWALNEEVVKEIKQKWLTQVDNESPSLTCQILEGGVLSSILEYAEKKASDLIIIGQQRKARALTGTLVTNLVRYSKCSTLVVPHHSTLNLSTIIVPVDFSEHSAEALYMADQINYLQDGQIKIVVSYVLDLPTSEFYVSPGLRQQRIQELKAQSEARLNRFVLDHIPRSGGNCVQKVELNTEGIVPHLSDHASEEFADLMIIGAKGHSTLSNLLLGSTAEKLIKYEHRIPIPIMIIR